MHTQRPSKVRENAPLSSFRPSFARSSSKLCPRTVINGVSYKLLIVISCDILLLTAPIAILARQPCDPCRSFSSRGFPGMLPRKMFGWRWASARMRKGCNLSASVPGRSLSFPSPSLQLIRFGAIYEIR